MHTSRSDYREKMTGRFKDRDKRESEARRTDLRKVAQAEVPIKHLMEQGDSVGWTSVQAILQKEVDDLDNLLRQSLPVVMGPEVDTFEKFLKLKFNFLQAKARRDAFAQVIAMPKEMAEEAKRANAELKSSES